MKASELRKKNVEELSNLLKETQLERFQLRLQVATNQTQTVHILKVKRRQIARIKTILTQKAQEVSA